MISRGSFEQSDHMVRATRCAIECQTELVTLNKSWSSQNRLAGLTPSGQVWVNQRNAETLPMYLPSVMLAAISMRGRAQPVAPYRVWPPP